MPTYQYACTVCGHRFEAVQAFTEATLTECPECAGRLRKVFSSVGIVFKGSGFYRTDSRSGAMAGGSSGEKSGDKSGDKSSSDAKSGSADSTKATKSSDSSSSSASTGATAKAS